MTDPHSHPHPFHWRWVLLQHITLSINTVVVDFMTFDYSLDFHLLYFLMIQKAPINLCNVDSSSFQFILKPTTHLLLGRMTLWWKVRMVFGDIIPHNYHAGPLLLLWLGRWISTETEVSPLVRQFIGTFQRDLYGDKCFVPVRHVSFMKELTLTNSWDTMKREE